MCLRCQLFFRFRELIFGQDGKTLGANRGSLDEVVNNPLELVLLRDFLWVLGVELGPKSPSHSCSGLKLSVLENDEGRLLSREGRITSKAEFLAWRGCHPGQKLIL